MTGRRFTRHISFVIDNCAEGEDRLMTIREVIPMLNSLADENEQLKSEIKLLRQKETISKLNEIENSTMESFLKKQRKEND